MDTFWIYKPYIILENYDELIPTDKMSRTKQMNTICRLIIYLIILTIIFDGNYIIILISLTLLIIIIIFYFINKSDIVGVKKDIEKENNEIEKYTNNNSLEQYTNQYINQNNINNNVINKKSLIDIYNNSDNKITRNINNKINKNIELQSGYIDFDGNYKIGKDYSDININDVKKNKPSISYNKNKLYVDNNCRKPTADNPWANIVFSDYLNEEDLAEPCNVDDKDVQTNMQNLYNSTIYRNFDDVFERENSQRIFYTVPIQTIPNKQTEFANWLYKTGPNCKENSNNCTYFEDPYMVSPRY